MKSELEQLRAENERLKNENTKLKEIVFAFSFDISNSIFMFHSGAELLKQDDPTMSTEELNSLHEIIFKTANKIKVYFEEFHETTKFLRPDL